MSINSNSTNIQLDTKRHSFAHLMAAAIGQMFPEAQYGVGPVIENGCYYDFVLPRNLVPEDLPLIENHIKDLLKRDLRFKVQELSLEDAINHFANANQPLKVELLENLRDRGTTSMSEEEKADFGGEAKPVITIYRIVDEKTGEVVFEDLCKGPHVAGVRRINNQNSERAETNNNQKAEVANSPLEGWQAKPNGVDCPLKDSSIAKLTINDKGQNFNSPLEGWTAKQDGVFNGMSTSEKFTKYQQLPYNPKLKEKAAELRKAGNLSEVLFWDQVKSGKLLDLDFERQKIVGNYIVDFYCPEIGLVVEIDGESHDFKGEYDVEREKYLVGLGLKVVHFADIEIKKAMDQVLESVYRICKKLNETPRQPAVATPQEGNYPPQLSSEFQEGNYDVEKDQNVGTDFDKTDLNFTPDINTETKLQESLNLQNMGFKLDKFSASYWRGDQERGINMQRLYALVFETKDELKAFITQREEAKKRDHRVLGQQMKLFTISEMVGAGLTLMQPKGTIMRNLLQQYLWQIHKPHGYQQLWTPHIAKEDLYIRSGHAGHYMDDMFSVYGGTSKEKFYLKPMNCPHHMQVFADNQFSYRDMPVRYFEPATVYRDEKTGQLSGLARVRNITQDDGHVFCRIGGIQAEVTIFANAVKQFYATMGMQADWVSLSVRDSVDRSKYLGTDENWDIAEKALEDAAIVNGFNYKRVEGEAAFYGPKLDFMFKDCLGRQWQLSTIQCDFNLPERFDLSFKNEDGEQERPVVLHRAVAGSYERFMGIMIENYAGKFPFWLAPEQIRILTINDEVLPFVDKIKAQLDQVVLMQPLKYNELRYSLDDRMESLGKKIRDTKLDKIPMFIVVGMKDVEEGIVSIEYAGESVKVPLGEVKAWMENIKN